MSSCLGLLLLGGASRLALIAWWLVDPARVLGAFDGWSRVAGSFVGASWIWPLAGFILLPWTTLAYVYVVPRGLSAIEWVLIGIALVVDLGTHGAGGRVYGGR